MKRTIAAATFRSLVFALSLPVAAQQTFNSNQSWLSLTQGDQHFYYLTYERYGERLPNPSNASDPAFGEGYALMSQFDSPDYPDRTGWFGDLDAGCFFARWNQTTTETRQGTTQEFDSVLAWRAPTDGLAQFRVSSDIYNAQDELPTGDFGDGSRLQLWRNGVMFYDLHVPHATRVTVAQFDALNWEVPVNKGDILYFHNDPYRHAASSNRLETYYGDQLIFEPEIDLMPSAPYAPSSGFTEYSNAIDFPRTATAQNYSAPNQGVWLYEYYSGGSYGLMDPVADPNGDYYELAGVPVAVSNARSKLQGHSVHDAVLTFVAPHAGLLLVSSDTDLDKGAALNGPTEVVFRVTKRSGGPSSPAVDFLTEAVRDDDAIPLGFSVHVQQGDMISIHADADDLSSAETEGWELTTDFNWKLYPNGKNRDVVVYGTESAPTGWSLDGVADHAFYKKIKVWGDVEVLNSAELRLDDCVVELQNGVNREFSFDVTNSNVYTNRSVVGGRRDGIELARSNINVSGPALWRSRGGAVRYSYGHIFSGPAVFDAVDHRAITHADFLIGAVGPDTTYNIKDSGVALSLRIPASVGTAAFDLASHRPIDWTAEAVFGQSGTCPVDVCIQSLDAANTWSIKLENTIVRDWVLATDLAVNEVASISTGVNNSFSPRLNLSGAVGEGVVLPSGVFDNTSTIPDPIQAFGTTWDPDLSSGETYISTWGFTINGGSDIQVVASGNKTEPTLLNETLVTDQGGASSARVIGTGGEDLELRALTASSVGLGSRYLVENCILGSTHTTAEFLAENGGVAALVGVRLAGPILLRTADPSGAVPSRIIIARPSALLDGVDPNGLVLLEAQSAHVHRVLDHWAFDDNVGAWTSSGGISNDSIVDQGNPTHPHNKSIRLDFTSGATSGAIQIIDPESGTGTTPTYYDSYIDSSEVYFVTRIRTNIPDLRMEFGFQDRTLPASDWPLFSRTVQVPDTGWQVFQWAIGSGSNAGDPLVTGGNSLSLLDQIDSWSLSFRSPQPLPSGSFVELDHITVTDTTPHPDLLMDH